MRVLMIGGTGTISTPITRKLAEKEGIELFVLNRGSKPLPTGAKQLIGDYTDTPMMEELISEHQFDVVMNFVIFSFDQAKQQVELFKNRIKQYIFISTVVTYRHDDSIEIREDHEQGNPNSEYGQEKIKCEEVFLQDKDFPVTIVRPSQTYSNDRIPLSVKGKSCYSVIDRILQDKPVIVHGDGQSIWHCTHADDFAKGFLPLVGNEKAIRQAFNLVNPEVVTWNQIYQHLYKLLDKKPNIVHIASDLLAESTVYDNTSAILGDKTNSNYYNTDKLRQLAPEFNCEINIKRGLEMYLQYLTDHPEAKKSDPLYDKWCDDVIASYQAYTNEFHEKF